MLYSIILFVLTYVLMLAFDRYRPIIALVSAAIFVFTGLLSGATLEGNLTPVGASANITGIGILRKAGYTVKNSDFLRIGIPFTFAAIIPAYLYFWILYR